MSRNELQRRVDALEGQKTGGWGQGPAIWVVRKAGESADEAIDRYEASYGPRLPGQPAVIWKPVLGGAHGTA